jgi:aspartate carbamoyltransferase catalytic subunit
MRNPQLNQRGELTHLLTTEGLSRAILTRILDTTALFLASTEGALKKTPLLQDKKILSLVDDIFADKASTDVGVFESAAQSLSAEWLGIQKLDLSTISSFSERHIDIVLLRTEASGVPFFIAQQIGAHTHVVNAGDGCHADPTSALLDMHTIRCAKNDFSNLTVVLVGDVLHSRHARSCIHALTTLCVAEVRVVAPLTLLPEGLAQFGVRAYTHLADGLRDADVVIMLDQERTGIDSTYIPSAREYVECYGLTEEKLACAKPDCLVLGTEGSRKASGGAGIAVRMAALSLVAGALA